jgi:uncharacterized protein (DUF362 family)
MIAMDPVALLSVKGSIHQALQHALQLLGGFPALASPIVIKPNLCTDIDDTGAATTSVDTVAALVQLLVNSDPSLAIRIVESDSESKYADDAFTKLGYVHLVTEYQSKGYDVQLVNLSDPPLQNAQFSGAYFTNPPLHPLLLECGSLISLAVPKTHSLTLVTGVMKNLFGLLPRKGQSFYHPAINEVIVDLNRCITPSLCIVDARLGLEGVISGRPRRLNAVVVGTHPVSVDAVMAQIMGFDPTTIRHIVDAVPYNLGTTSPHIIGTTLASIRTPFATPTHLRSTALI